MFICYVIPQSCAEKSRIGAAVAIGANVPLFLPSKVQTSKPFRKGLGNKTRWSKKHFTALLEDEVMLAPPTPAHGNRSADVDGGFRQ